MTCQIIKPQNIAYSSFSLSLFIYLHPISLFHFLFLPHFLILLSLFFLLISSLSLISITPTTIFLSPSCLFLSLFHFLSPSFYPNFLVSQFPYPSSPLLVSPSSSSSSSPLVSLFPLLLPLPISSFLVFPHSLLLPLPFSLNLQKSTFLSRPRYRLWLPTIASRKHPVVLARCHNARASLDPHAFTFTIFFPPFSSLLFSLVLS